MNKSLAILSVAGASILWGFVGICSRALSDAGLSSIQINACRGFVCTIILGIGLFVLDRKSLSVQRNKLPRLILLALFKFAMDLCYIQSVIMIDLSLACILLCTDSYFVLILSFFLYRKGITPMKVAATFIGFFGCTMVMDIYAGVDHINVEGVLYGLGSGVFGSMYTLTMKRTMDDGMKATAVLFYLFLIGSLIYLFIMDVPSMATMISNDLSIIGYSVLFGVMFTFFPYFLYSTGLKELEPVVVTVLMFLEAVTSALVGLFFFGEEMTPIMIIGMAVVLVSVIMMDRDTKSSDTGS